MRINLPPGRASIDPATGEVGRIGDSAVADLTAHSRAIPNIGSLHAAAVATRASPIRSRTAPRRFQYRWYSGNFLRVAAQRGTNLDRDRARCPRPRRSARHRVHQPVGGRVPILVVVDADGAVRAERSPVLRESCYQERRDPQPGDRSRIHRPSRSGPAQRGDARSDRHPRRPGRRATRVPTSGFEWRFETLSTATPISLPRRRRRSGHLDPTGSTRVPIHTFTEILGSGPGVPHRDRHLTAHSTTDTNEFRFDVVDAGPRSPLIDRVTPPGTDDPIVFTSDADAHRRRSRSSSTGAAPSIRTAAPVVPRVPITAYDVAGARASTPARPRSEGAARTHQLLLHRRSRVHAARRVRHRTAST